MKILVTGADGMLGHEIVCVGQGVGISMVVKSHEDLDITDMETAEAILVEEKPDILVNCAGIVRSRTDISSKQFYMVNGEAPIQMAKLCDRYGIKVVQSSTDCVFKGDRPHVESDKPNAQDVYGRSKALGEVDNGIHLTTRCSFIGFGDRGLLAWLMKQSGHVFGYRNSKWNGLTVNYAAQAIIDFAISDVSGILHIFGTDTTKYDVLVAANRIFKLGMDIVPVEEPMEDHRLRTERQYRIFVPKIEDQMKEMASPYQGNRISYGQGTILSQNVF